MLAKISCPKTYPNQTARKEGSCQWTSTRSTEAGSLVGGLPLSALLWFVVHMPESSSVFLSTPGLPSITQDDMQNLFFYGMEALSHPPGTANFPFHFPCSLQLSHPPSIVYIIMWVK